MEEDIAAKLRQAERTANLSNAETKRRERELRELRAELRESTTRLEESHATMELLARRTADALTEKNRVQHVAWQLKRRLQQSAEPRSRSHSKQQRSDSEAEDTPRAKTRNTKSR